jgi:hypothetical protein
LSSKFLPASTLSNAFSAQRDIAPFSVCGAAHIGSPGSRVGLDRPVFCQHREEIRRDAMRIRILLLALLLASALLPAAPAQACPAGYRVCGNYCCR